MIGYYVDTQELNPWDISAAIGVLVGMSETILALYDADPLNYRYVGRTAQKVLKVSNTVADFGPGAIELTLDDLQEGAHRIYLTRTTR